MYGTDIQYFQKKMPEGGSKFESVCVGTGICVHCRTEVTLKKPLTQWGGETPLFSVAPPLCITEAVMNPERKQNSQLFFFCRYNVQS